MSGENSDAPVKARADIQMRIVLDARRYADVGQLMDDVQEAIVALLAGHPKARFDFVGFQTHPCKAMRMDQAAALASPYAMTPDQFELDEDRA